MTSPRMKRRTIGYIYITAAVFFLLAAACGPVRRPPEPDNLYWPMPPDPPRIKYIQSIYSEDDIGRVYTFMEKLFGKEYGDSIGRPYGVYTRRNRIYVADILLRGVLIFDLTAKRLMMAGREGAVKTPAAAVSDAADNIYVADAAGAKVVVYDNRGKYRTSFIIKDGRPVALAINGALGRLYVVDRGGHRVVVFDLDGKQLFDFGTRGRANGQFNIPLDVALDDKGNVYVVDNGNFRVQIFNADGTFISKFGSVGDKPGMFANPKGIALDSEGHIYVTDAAYSNVQIFDQQGNVLLAVGGLGPWPGYMHLPAGISIDENDRIYVADQLNGRIQVFQYLKAPQ